MVHPDAPCAPGKNSSHVAVWLIFICVFSMVVDGAGAAPAISDTIPITGYYEQAGKDLSRRKLEKFLRLSDDSIVNDFGGRSRIVRLTAGGIGATVWGINLGVSIYQITYLVRAFENNEPISVPLANLAAPLAIGGQLSSLTQGVLRNRSDFLLYKSVMEFNRQVMHRLYPDSVQPYRIEKLRYGWYRQDQLEMPEQLLYLTLRENEPSRISANWSIFFRETAQPAYIVGGMLLLNAIMGFIEPAGVRPEARTTQLGIGIGCTGFGILTTVIADIFRSRAIDRYNKTDPHRETAPGINEAE